MAQIELNAQNELKVTAFRTEDEAGEITLVIRAGDGTVRVRCGRTADDAEQLGDILRAAAVQAEQEAENWDDRPDEQDNYVTLDRGRWYVTFSGSIQPDGQPRNGYPDKSVACYELATLMAEHGEFGASWTSGEHGPAAESIDAEIRAFHDEGGDKLLPLDGVIFEPGDSVRYDGDESMEVIRDYGTLGVWLAVAGDHSAGEAFVRDRKLVQPVYEPGQLIECVSHRLGSVNSEWVPAVFRDGPHGHGTVTVYSLYNALRGLTSGWLIRPLAEVRPVPARLLHEAKCWIADNQWADVADEGDVADLTGAQIAAGIQRHYAGGWAAFRRDAG